ncbi:Jag N-terminal domain-containing protein [Campylobacter sp. IFREMER_LSEM_CL1846]|uniref:Jag N-terminal domain-containing protein n=1 Tax=Campylobacter sp. IFREMER_LSEM_CL1846 TaxID=2911614 RepID=UPI0021E654A7|nr:Jag N-terminal domain-containing protein [Campylobacter sp. IFREMER_LSEM_CL1846]HEC1747625.1 Jag N-terminal domain-containing protein [Campylobacter lari]MCV3434271.1 Jag N-terminal domain-containing protein [Campylobacter sp. IFREMER_LSEM_CL1846]HEC1768066.1 Jag N-terminal domain-containing protein [Campylobacter lari]HEC1788598.1 Jag N-terminal domain-containing protein [Campylobacter lari]HEC1795557.1 Jag N-terminal domain-containing protein [Campylobacter lari]
MNIEAKDLQTALIEASKQLECSVIDLEYEVIQHAKAGFFGLFKKNAIICIKGHKKTQKVHNEKPKKIQNEKFNKYSQKNFEKKEYKKEYKENFQKPIENIAQPKEHYKVKNDAIFDSFHKESSEEKNIVSYIDEIKISLENLLATFDFDIKVVQVSVWDETCVLIKLDGKDAALLIGKEAHRYKAFSYLLYNWLNAKYKIQPRLEIAQFLENQTQAIDSYLKILIEKVENTGRVQTKPLDGIWLKLALEKLRERFPDKYVAIKQNDDQRYIVVNDFLKKNE